MKLEEKKISLNWKKYPIGFKLGKKSSSSNLIFQTGELEKSGYEPKSKARNVYKISYFLQKKLSHFLHTFRGHR
jgi:hypothetical protein